MKSSVSGMETQVGSISRGGSPFRYPMSFDDLDEHIQIDEAQQPIDGADEEVIELVLNSTLSSFSWDDIMRFSTVCQTWRMVIRGQLTAKPQLFDLFKAKYPDEEVLFLPT